MVVTVVAVLDRNDGVIVAVVEVFRGGRLAVVRLSGRDFPGSPPDMDGAFFCPDSRHPCNMSALMPPLHNTYRLTALPYC
jgi:hypothetical protein